MNWKSLHVNRAVLLLIAIILLFFVFLLDMAFHFRQSPPQNITWIRELLVLSAFGILLPVLYRREDAERQNVMRDLKSLFLAVLGLGWTIFLLRVVGGPVSLPTRDLPGLFSSFGSLLNSSLTAIFTTIFCILIFLNLRRLILYRAKKRVRRSFRLLLILVGAHTAYIVATYDVAASFPKFDFPQRPIPASLAVIILLLMVLASFRTRWVNYLNKKQKISSFWGGILLLTVGIAAQNSANFDSISYYSLILGNFSNFSLLFASIYIGVSLVSLLLHLPTASLFDKKMKEINSLFHLSRTISSVLDYDQVVSKVTDLTIEVTNADYAWLELLSEDNGRLEIVSSRNLSTREIQSMNLDPGKGVSGWVIQNKRSLLINQVYKDSRSRYLRSWKEGMGSLLGVPLMSQGRVKGILFALKNEEFGFDQDDREMLQAFANQAIVAIENARLVQTSLEKERLEQELRLAHEAQMKLLPKEMPRVEGLDIDGVCLTANEVGGDYFDFIRLPGGKLGVVIGDVSGKGISAAFHMAQVKGVIDGLGRVYRSPKELLERVNRSIYEKVDRKTFVSLIYAIFDLKRRQVTFSRAGHCPLFYFSSQEDQIRCLQPPGIGVGLDRGMLFDRILVEESLPLHAGDVFLFFTDGVIEARNGERQEFEEENLKKVFWEVRGASASEIKERIIGEIKAFIGGAGMHDDLSLVVVKVQK